ncbi:hypothetical protein JCM33374_g4947 [Metschnikowia sp. JCM 33374]|nr:hypothetical protein JCM33374_g4947 [Metschnikowia sp. JCM 33374]
MSDDYSEMTEKLNEIAASLHSQSTSGRSSSTGSVITTTPSSYDFHTYWRDSHPEEKKFCVAFREKVSEHFAKEIEEGRLRVHKLWDRPVGPHPIHMWELDTAGKFDPELFGQVLAFYQLNHGNLSVLVHPHTSAGSLADHTQHAVWLGYKQDLILDFL